MADDKNAALITKVRGQLRQLDGVFMAPPTARFTVGDWAALSGDIDALADALEAATSGQREEQVVLRAHYPFPTVTIEGVRDLFVQTAEAGGPCPPYYDANRDPQASDVEVRVVVTPRAPSA